MDYCPKCAMPTYVGGVCMNNDCNFPNVESNNERARRSARAEAERRERAEQEARAARDRQERERQEREAAERRKKEAEAAEKTRPPVKARTDWSWLAAIIAFVIGAGVAGGSWNFEGGAVFVIGGIAAVIGGLFYKQIVGFAILVVIAIVVFSSLNDKSDSQNQPPIAQPEPVVGQPAASPVSGTPAAGKWGAIAYSPTARNSAWAVNYADVDSAVSGAIGHCAQSASDCQWAAKFDQCGALVASDGGYWAGDFGATESEAEGKARASCEQHGQACKLLIAKCNG